MVGSPVKFRETFHDNGLTDMAKMMRLYNSFDLNTPIRSDHVPTMAGESNEHFGYEMKGNLFGIGYKKRINACLRLNSRLMSHSIALWFYA